MRLMAATGKVTPPGARCRQPRSRAVETAAAAKPEVRASGPSSRHRSLRPSARRRCRIARPRDDGRGRYRRPDRRTSTPYVGPLVQLALDGLIARANAWRPDLDDEVGRPLDVQLRENSVARSLATYNRSGSTISNREKTTSYEARKTWPIGW